MSPSSLVKDLARIVSAVQPPYAKADTGADQAPSAPHLHCQILIELCDEVTSYDRSGKRPHRRKGVHHAGPLAELGLIVASALRFRTWFGDTSLCVRNVVASFCCRGLGHGRQSITSGNGGGPFRSLCSSQDVSNTGRRKTNDGS